MPLPPGYLVTAVLLACCTFFAVAPPPTCHTRPTGLSFRLGFLVNELPAVALAVLVACTAVGVRRGRHRLGHRGAGGGRDRRPDDRRARRGDLAGVADRGDRRTRAGRGARAGLAGRRHRQRRAAGQRPRSAHALLAPFRVRRRDVEHVADIRYGDGERNRLDVYRHRSHPSGAPTFVHLHGGAFRAGRKDREARPLLYRLARDGWVCVSADYRLSPDATFPDQLVDVKQVVAWTREHGPEFGADPMALVIAGSSAGGHLAADAALTANDPRFQPGFEGVDTSVTAAVLLYPYLGSVDTRAPMPSSPMAFVRGDAPPFFVAHGDPRHVGARRRRPVVRGAAAGRVAPPGRVRRAARGPARLRPVPLAPLRRGRQRRRRLHGVGAGGRRAAAPAGYLTFWAMLNIGR